LTNAIDAWQEEHDHVLSLSQLAKAIEVDETTLQSLLNNTADSISLDLLDCLCMALDCTPNDILRHLADPERQYQLSTRLGGDLGTSVAG
jgi:DNA-binding Xre family transcriptional regulator